MTPSGMCPSSRSRTSHLGVPPPEYLIIFDSTFQTPSGGASEKPRRVPRGPAGASWASGGGSWAGTSPVRGRASRVGARASRA